jgi:O-antigen/teichoic acid export membrane protein
MFKDKPNEHLVRTHGIVIVISLCWYIANFLLNMLLARYLNPARYGDISVVLQVLSFAVPFILLGTDYSIPRFIPKYVSSKKFDHVKGFRSWNKKLLKVTFTICYIIGFIAVTIALVLNHYNIHSIDKFHPAIYSFWLIPLFGYWSLESSIFDAFRRYIMSTSINLFFTIIFIILLVIAALIFKNLTVYHIMFVIGFACIFLIVMLALSIRSSLPKNYTSIHENTSDKKAWLKTSLNMMISSIVFSGLASIDIIMLEILGKNENDVGYLGAIFTVFGIFAIINASSSMLVMPNISIFTGSSEQRLQYLRQIMGIVQSIKLITSIVIFIILFFVGRHVLAFFGPLYPSVYWPLIAISIGHIIAMALGASQLILFYAGHEKEVVIISLVQIATVLILDSALIPFYDLYGAIIGLIAGQWVAAITSVILVKRHYGFTTMHWRFKPPEAPKD